MNHLHPRRRPHPDGRVQRQAEGRLGDRSRRDCVPRGDGTDRREAGDDRSRRLRQRPAHERRRGLRRAARRAQGGCARRSARAHGQPVVRLRPPVGHQRRPDDPARGGRHRPRRRHGEHEPGAARHTRVAQRAAARSGAARGHALVGAARHALRLHDGGDRRELRRQVRHEPRGAGLLRAAQSATRAQGVEVGTARGRSRRRRSQGPEGRGGLCAGRSPASGHDRRRPREAAAGLHEERVRHGRQRVGDRRWRGRDAAGVREGREGLRARAARPAHAVGDGRCGSHADGNGARRPPHAWCSTRPV